MTLDPTQQRLAWRAMRDTDPTIVQWTKPQLDAAVAAVDAWCDANQASFVAAIPQPIRTASNAQQKALLLAYTVMKRAGVI